MNSVGQTICLSMIVKNEATVIRRCLDSVRSLIDHWVIVDTGSTDGTQDIIRDYLKDVPGELVERPWQDFAHNRTEALELARPYGDYTFIIDADDALELDAGYQLPELTIDSYLVDIHDRTSIYQRVQFVCNTRPWRYTGVLHEFLTVDGPQSRGHLPLVMRRNHDGARRNDPTTYQKDAAILEAALEVETDSLLTSRYTFYLAQSYRDSGQNEKALEKYLARATQGHWEEEVFVALLEAARIMERLERPAAEVLSAYARATSVVSSRAEALHGASRYCRYKSMYDEGYRLALEASAFNAPKGGLFIENWIYDYGILDELSVNAYWAKEYDQSIKAGEQLLKRQTTPTSYIERVKSNILFSKQNLPPCRYTKFGRYVIVTPYYKESPDIIRRCIESVRRQSVRTEHILVSDGFPQDWIDTTGVRHIKLDRNHQDWGNTPRGIGCIIAASERYDGIGLLDADCWLETDHVEQCIEAISKTSDTAYVVAKTIDRRPDKSIMTFNQESHATHVDTNAFFYFQESFHKLPIWALMPSQVSAVCDRVFFMSMKEDDLKPAFTMTPTVNYVCTWESVYKLLGEQPPPGAKPNPDHPAIISWIESLDDRRYENENKLIQGNLSHIYSSVNRPAAGIKRNSGITTNWAPAKALGGTELTVNEVNSRLKLEISRVNLFINDAVLSRPNDKPSIVWIHHDINEDAVQWLNDINLRSNVDWYVFVSNWQKERFISHFSIPEHRCKILRNATDVPYKNKVIKESNIRRFAYTSVPFRGLDVLLEAWEVFNEKRAELHIWSSIKIYGPNFSDDRFESLYRRARSMKGVYWHGIVPNTELRRALLDIDYLAYPSVFRETSCLAVIEAMAAGCRIICPALGALPETTAGFAHLYPVQPDTEAHVAQFASALQQEFQKGMNSNSEIINSQQNYTRAIFDWTARQEEWRNFLSECLI